MSLLSMDVSSGETAAICDFGNDIDPRKPFDFISDSGTACVLCGSVNAVSSSGVIRHMSCTVHITRLAKYRNCMRSLLVHERSALDRSASGVTAREVVLVYLADRIARADVIRGIGQYSAVAVSYLLRRASTPELLRAFTTITATEQGTTRGLCSICLETFSSMMFEQCMHVCACTSCVAKLRIVAESAESLPCPICRVSSNAVTVFIT